MVAAAGLLDALHSYLDIMAEALIADQAVT